MFLKTSLFLCFFLVLIKETLHKETEIKEEHGTGLFCATGGPPGSSTYCGAHGICVIDDGCRSIVTCYSNPPGTLCSESYFSGICQPTSVIQDLSNPCCGTRCCCDPGWTGDACNIPPICPPLLENCTNTLNETISEGIVIIETLIGEKTTFLILFIVFLVLFVICVVLTLLVFVLCYYYLRMNPSKPTRPPPPTNGNRMLLNNQH